MVVVVVVVFWNGKWLEAWILYVYKTYAVPSKNTSYIVHTWYMYECDTQHNMHWAPALYIECSRFSHQFKVLYHLPFNGNKLCEMVTYTSTFWTRAERGEKGGEVDRTNDTHHDSLIEASIWPNEKSSLLSVYSFIHSPSLTWAWLHFWFSPDRFRSSHKIDVFLIPQPTDTFLYGSI